MREFVESPGSRFRDHLDPKVADWLVPFQADAAFDVAFLGAPLSKTSISHSAAFRLPDAVRSAFAAMSPYNVNHRLDLADKLGFADMGNVRMHVTDLARCHDNIEAAAAAYWQDYRKPLVVLGGDHSITAPSVMGFAKATSKTIGIVHFDAHHDVRNLEDGGRTYGTPFRTLLESGTIAGENLVQIGLRDYANAAAYHRYVLEHGATVYTARDVHRHGMADLVEEALERAADRTDAVYVSFDLDVLDQSLVPGVPAPGPAGMTVWDAVDALEWLGQQSMVEAMDVVCGDPLQDYRDLTTRVAALMVMSFLTGLALR